jgi:hypothetical protein
MAMADRYEIKKDGRKVAEIEASDAREAGGLAIMRWGPGNYNVKLIRDDDCWDDDDE